MSVFRVKLADFNNPVDTRNFGTTEIQAMQRTIYLTGPHGTSRVLHHGDTFTDTNYFKRFAFPVVPASEAVLELLSDDGSDWDDGKGAVNAYPKVYNITAAGGSTYAANVANIYSDTGSTTLFCQIRNTSQSQNLKIRLNGSAILDLPADSTQVFNALDLPLSLIEIDNSASGATSANVQILCSVKSYSKT